MRARGLSWCCTSVNERRPWPLRVCAIDPILRACGCFLLAQTASTTCVAGHGFVVVCLPLRCPTLSQDSAPQSGQDTHPLFFDTRFAQSLNSKSNVQSRFVKNRVRNVRVRWTIRVSAVFFCSCFWIVHLFACTQSARLIQISEASYFPAPAAS